MKSLLIRILGTAFTQKFCNFHQKEVKLFRSIFGLSANK
jgi:hypothetical protein